MGCASRCWVSVSRCWRLVEDGPSVGVSKQMLPTFQLFTDSVFSTVLRLGIIVLACMD